MNLEDLGGMNVQMAPIKATSNYTYITPTYIIATTAMPSNQKGTEPNNDHHGNFVKGFLHSKTVKF